MSSNEDANRYLRSLGPTVRELATGAHDRLSNAGCSSYVKTIYIGYDLGGEMVAALYAHANHVEVALALPEDADSALLIDAGHLTWRTLPVAALLRVPDDLVEFSDLVAQAAQRVVSQQHDVSRDNDYFARRRTRERRR